MIGLVVLCALVPRLHATEILGGTLQKNTILSPENGDYLVSQDLIIPENITLTIEPGTEIKLMLNVSIKVKKGTFICEGTKENPIIISAFDQNKWAGIEITTSSSIINEAGQISGTRISNIQIRDALIGLSLIDGASIVVENILVSQCNYGIMLDNDASIKLLSSKVSTCSWGLTIKKSSRNEIRECEISDCQFAIYFTSETSKYNKIINNRISHNMMVGLFMNNILGEVQYNKISCNQITNNRIGLHLDNYGSPVTGFNSIVDNEIKFNSSHGIRLSQDNDTVMYNRVEGNQVGLELKAGNNNLIKNNLFKKNLDWSILLTGNSTLNTFEQNNIIENSRGIRIFPDKENIPMNNRISFNTFTNIENELVSIESGPQQKLEYNTLLASKTCSFVNKYNGKIYASNNYWGTIISDSINRIIHDITEDPSSGEVVYLQTLDKPHPEAPILKPMNPIKQQVAGNVLVSWKRNLEEDIAGYRIYLNSKLIKTCGAQDTAVQLSGVDIFQPIMITSFDNKTDGIRDIFEGHESDSSTFIEMPFAGSDTYICHDDTYWTKTATARAYESIRWLTSGDGKFIDSTLLETFYMPGENDKLVGVVNLTLRLNSPGGKALTDNMELQIHEYPILEAGNDTTIAEGMILMTSNAFAKNYTTLKWLTSGDGKFDNSSNLISSYTPGIKDIERRHVELTLVLNSSCSNVMDKFTVNIIPGYDISGTIRTENVKIAGAVVIAYKVEDEITDACVTVKTNERGEFKFTNIPYGKYYLYAVADPHNYPNHYPTYWGSVSKWEDAKLHELNSDTFDVDIKLNRLDTLLPSGEGSIKGNCFYQGDPSEGDNEIYQHDWFGNLAHSNQKAGSACNHVILLMNPDLTKVIGWTLSSTDGSFDFQNLPFGRYRIMGEKAGYENKVSSLVQLSTEKPSTDNASIVVNNNYKIIQAMVSGTLIAQDYVYPNPASEKIFVSTSGFEDNTTIEIRIIDQKGITVLTKQIEKSNAFTFGPIDISMLQTGVYICNIVRVDGLVRSSKLIIN